MQNTIKGKIDTWFPKSVYVADNVLTDHLPILENCIRKQLSGAINRTTMQEVNSSHIVNDKLFNLQEFKPLVQQIQFHAFEYLSAVGYSKEQITSMQFINMWSNLSKENDFLFPHNHSGSILSGAFYVKTLPDSKIKFFDNPSMMIKPASYNELSYEFCEYQCIPGRLLLFKSDFLHGVGRQGPGEKIVVSFNIG